MFFKGASTQRIKEKGKMDRTGQNRVKQERETGRQGGCVQTGREERNTEREQGNDEQKSNNRRKKQRKTYESKKEERFQME